MEDPNIIMATIIIIIITLIIDPMVAVLQEHPLEVVSEELPVADLADLAELLVADLADFPLVAAASQVDN